ncbi:MAG: hypothetical protein ABW185_06300 [Sedimenticola sp.]
MSKGHLLRNKPYSISRDFPTEIVQARKLLWPRYKELRSRYPGNSVNIVYPAKLINNGKIVIDMFPRWNEFMRMSRVNYKQLCLQLSADQSQPPRATHDQPPTAAYTQQRDTGSRTISPDSSLDEDFTRLDNATTRSFAVPYRNPPTANVTTTAPSPSANSAGDPASPSLISGNPRDDRRHINSPTGAPNTHGQTPQPPQPTQLPRTVGHDGTLDHSVNRGPSLGARVTHGPNTNINPD